MVNLAGLLKGLSYISSHSKEVLERVKVDDICYDSRKTKKNTVFVCIKGEITDGVMYVESAYNQGCRIFVCEEKTELLNKLDNIYVIKVENARKALAIMSHNYFGKPARELMVIGVTGTKGKTIVANLLYDALKKLSINTGYIGTNGVYYNNKVKTTINTTPESYELAKIFREMLNNRVSCVIMEVSSLGVMMHRIHGIDFFMGVFTNISPDHIGPTEHESFDDYLRCKVRFFLQCENAMLNIDDPNVDKFIDICKKVGCNISTYSLNSRCDFKASDIKNWQSENSLGVSFDVVSNNSLVTCKVPMPGEFSVYNTLAVIGVMSKCCPKTDLYSICSSLKNQSVKGRMEIVNALDYCTFIIDYAHNQISFENLFKTLMPYKKGKLIAVFGSVGDRTKDRRKELAQVASKYCDKCYITSDNPSFEEPQQIIDEIVSNLVGDIEYETFVDREDAVKFAVANAKKDDIIVFCGKGHEDYQLIKGEKVPFSERDIILKECEKIILPVK